MAKMAATANGEKRRSVTYMAYENINNGVVKTGEKQ